MQSFLREDLLFDLPVQADKKRLEKDEGVSLSDIEFGDAPGTDNESADEAEELANELDAAETLKSRVDEIDEALAKIAKGTYGICEECGQKIDITVLEVAPESRLCRDCKKKTR